ACAMHRQIEMTVAIALVDNVSTVLRDRRTDPSLDQFLDLVDDLGVGGVFLDPAVGGDLDARGTAGREQWGAADEMIEQGLEYERLEIGPRHAGRDGHRDEVAAVKHPFDHAAIKQSSCER